MKIKYVGGSPSRSVGQVLCVRGEPVEIKDEIAEHLLLKAVWVKAEDDKPAAKKGKE